MRPTYPAIQPRAALALAAAVLSLVPRAATAVQETTSSFPADAQVVLLDVVARDKKGRQVPDLRPDELTVSEDGRRCEILSFRLVRPPTTAPSEAAAAPPDAAADPGAVRTKDPTAVPARANLVILVFDALSVKTAPFTRRGAFELLDRSFPPDTWFAVFKVTWKGTFLVQPFTSEPGRLKSAVEAATRGDDARRSRETPTLLPPRREQEELPDTAATAGLPPGLPDLREVAKELGQGERAQLADNAVLDSLYGLLGIARALEPVRARKSIVYFAEAWHADTRTQGVYEAAVSAANRANVTIHVVDARGLSYDLRARPLSTFDAALSGPSVRSPMPEAHLNAAGGESPTPMSWALETVEDTLAGPRNERIADDTGGLLIAHTNDLGVGLARVVEELNHYYEVVYAPPNPVPDGRFRHIGVRVSRPGVRVRTRAGYFATPTASPTLLAHELPLISALGAKEPAHDFAVRAGVLHFGVKGEERESVVIVEVPLGGVQLVADETRDVYRARLTMLAHLKDDQGRIVARLTHDWPIEGPIGERQGARLTSASFRRTLTLAPGRYQLEAAVQDRLAAGSSVVRTSFVVPAPGPPGPRLGSVALLRRVEQAAPDQHSYDPLRIGDVTAMPGLQARYLAGSVAELPVFVPIYPAALPDPLALTLELRRGGEVVTRATPALPPPGADGRIAWLGTIPLGRLPAGGYRLAVTASQGAARAEQTISFEIAPGPQPGP